MLFFFRHLFIHSTLFSIHTSWSCHNLDCHLNLYSLWHLKHLTMIPFYQEVGRGQEFFGLQASKHKIKRAEHHDGKKCGQNGFQQLDFYLLLNSIMKTGELLYSIIHWTNPFQDLAGWHHSVGIFLQVMSPMLDNYTPAIRSKGMIANLLQKKHMCLRE